MNNKLSIEGLLKLLQQHYRILLMWMAIHPHYMK